MALSLIANTGIHIFPLKLKLDLNDRSEIWFHEHYNHNEGKWVLDLVEKIDKYYYNKKQIVEGGFLVEDPFAKHGENDREEAIDRVIGQIADEGIKHLKIDGEDDEPGNGDIYSMRMGGKHFDIEALENKWLPLPYFARRTEAELRPGSYNWCRIKLIPEAGGGDKSKRYTALLAFDTRAGYKADKYDEHPVFLDNFCKEMKYELCADEFMLMDYCAPQAEDQQGADGQGRPQPEHGYINDYLFSLAHPNLHCVGEIRHGKRLGYVASYIFLVNYLAKNGLLPHVVLHKDMDVENIDVDMVVDIGNSRTTALLLEQPGEQDGGSMFTNISKLELVNYANLLRDDDGDLSIRASSDPFDMRLAFRRVDFGGFGIDGSRQFVYPSFVRLGEEAAELIRMASESDEHDEKLTTHSSPKRYLWDGHRNNEEWKFMVLDGERDAHILNLPGISENLEADGRVGIGKGGQSYHYSRRSLMTFAFLEMLAQAQTQINGQPYRERRGNQRKPRRLRRLIVTCPTAMSKVEREALVNCARDAVSLLNNFQDKSSQVEIVPQRPASSDTEGQWYFDEATCSQLVYIYAEIGYKYKGSCAEFFDLYGKKRDGDSANSLLVGSIDIGAGTSDLMICKYGYSGGGELTTVKPDPLFYDSFYYAGDDMLSEMIANVMFFAENSALRRAIGSDEEGVYRQKLNMFFGPDHASQTVAQRKLRRDFNIQYSVPLMHYYLQLLVDGSADRMVGYDDVFANSRPSQAVVDGFKRALGIDLRQLEWQYCRQQVSDIVAKAFEPTLKKVATIMHSYGCDIVLLSGRPASLPPVRDIFLKYYTISPNRLILLNNYFVGPWYQFDSNTGNITDPKTIVAMGALVGYYATKLSRLGSFRIDKSALDANLKSVINYIEKDAPQRGASGAAQCVLTPDTMSGELMAQTMPTTLKVRQIGLRSYPSRCLYSIDYNRFKMADRIRRKALADGETPSDALVMARVKEAVDKLDEKLPFRLRIGKDPDNKEKLVIESITDRDGNDLSDSNIEINIQSLGINKQYWLDNGAFAILQ